MKAFSFDLFIQRAKHTLFLSVLFTNVLVAQQAPLNDLCTSPQPVSVQCPSMAIPISFSTLDANEELANSSCANGTMKDVWFVFNTGINNSIDLRFANGTAGHVGAEVFSSCSSQAVGISINGTTGNCISDVSTSPSHTLTGLMANTTYHLRLFTNESIGATGTGTFTLTGNDMIELSLNLQQGDFLWQGLYSQDVTMPFNWLVHNGMGFDQANSAPDSTINVFLPKLQNCVLHAASVLGNTFNVRDLTIDNGAAFFGGSGNAKIAGNWHQLGTFDAGTGMVTFTGTSLAEVNCADTVKFYKLRMNNTGDVQLNTHVEVHQNLTMSLGDIVLGENNLHMYSSTLTGGTGMSYVKTNGNGMLIRNVVDTVLFPIGLATFNSVKMIKPGVAFPFAVRLVDAVTVDGIDTGMVWNLGNVGRMWHVNPGVGYDPAVHGTLTLTLSYLNDAPYFSNFFSNNEGDRQMMHFNGGGWENITNVNGAFTTGINTLNYVWCTQSGVSDFSPFTVGNPLNNLAEMQHPTNGLRTFPNPSGGSFTILLPAHFRKNTTLTMTDAQGRVVLQEEVNSEEIQLNQNLSEGLYLLKCLNAEGRVIQKRHLITF
jgi:hypothetical protein